MLRSFLLPLAICVAAAVASAASNDPVLVGSDTAQQSPSKYFPSVSDEERSTYLEWIETHAEMTYSRSNFLPMVTDPSNGAVVFWKLFSEYDTATATASASANTAEARNNGNESYTHIQVAVAVRATGWVGFGISKAGGMLGSDIALFETADPTKIRDSYVLEEFDKPKEDDCQHDWTLLDTTIENGWLIVEMSRPLNTLDTQDHAIIDDSKPEVDPARLIAAWGDSDTATFHGFQVGKIVTKIFPQSSEASVEANSATPRSFEQLMEEQADGYFDILANNFTIPASETTYHYICKSFDELKEEFNLPETENGSLTFIGGGAMLSPQTAPYVHHFIVYGSSNPNQSEGNCSEHEGDMLWGWAPGEEPGVLPDNIGISLFDSNGNFRSLFVEVHYNNPEELEGLIDSSGFRVYYTVEPREIEAAWLTVGDPGVLLKGQTIGEGLREFTFACDGSCSSAVLDEPVTVISESLHMHKTGVMMTNEVIRAGEVVNLGKVEVFEFDQQGSFKVQQEKYQILSGDSFKTSCYYRDGTKFGMSSQEEMCVAFLLYYPAKKIDFGEFGSFPWACFYGIESLPVCKEELEIRALENVEQLQRTFGTPPAECMASKEPTGEPTPVDSAARNIFVELGVVIVAFALLSF